MTGGGSLPFVQQRTPNLAAKEGNKWKASVSMETSIFILKIAISASLFFCICKEKTKSIRVQSWRHCVWGKY